ncbi:MAG: hypothetical protein ABI947_05790 [Chloroflexota bacterium]
METPEAPRRPRRKKEPSEIPTDDASTEETTAKPARKPRKPKAAPESVSDAEMIAAIVTPVDTDTVVTPAESPDTILPAPDKPLVFTFPADTSRVPEPTTLSPLSPISPAPNANDNEPELYKPLMSPPPQTPPPAPIKPYNPPTQANPKPITILRTVVLRNIEIGQKYSASAGKNLREQTGKLAEPIGNARSEANKTLQRWQHSLETDDSAVVATTLIAIIVLVVLTLLVVALLQR